MIDVREYKLDDEFIKSLIDNINIWDISDVIQCTLYYNQRGAGCGKTHDSIQLLKDEKFKDKNIFIYLTKMHSAKEVIYTELVEQYKRKKLSNIKIDDGKDIDDDENDYLFMEKYMNIYQKIKNRSEDKKSKIRSQ